MTRKTQYFFKVIMVEVQQNEIALSNLKNNTLTLKKTSELAVLL